MADAKDDTSWIWHPSLVEDYTYTAGCFLHFRKTISVPSEQELPRSLRLHVTADTRYKFYVNSQLVCFGPVKGDASLWFYDEVDIAKYLKVGRNIIGVHVLRFFYASPYATSFPRLPCGGLRVRSADPTSKFAFEVETGPSWEVAMDKSLKLRIDEPEDEFLHVYEQSAPSSDWRLTWVPARVLSFQISTGQSTPWRLAPRMIPMQTMQEIRIIGLHNLKSCISLEQWVSGLAVEQREHRKPLHSTSMTLPANTTHQVDLEFSKHATAFLQLRFRRPPQGGSIIRITYAESYEDTPSLVPYLRRKNHRQDYTKELLGPSDVYKLQSTTHYHPLNYHEDEATVETLVPFHFRTFRFIRLQIDVKDSGLILESLKFEQVNYPLDVISKFRTECDKEVKGLWETSLQTLVNCMHDCYEDCPFYEQLQYAMDTRSSVLFTYYTSGDDRLARQAIIQMRNSFQAHLSLTASRSPSHRLQIIPHFSLFWIIMICDHWMYYGDRQFMTQFIPIILAVLSYFENLISPDLGLLRSENTVGIWNFHDWTDEWRPYGIPPAVVKSGYSTYTNNLFAYTLRRVIVLLRDLDNVAMAKVYSQRLSRLIEAIRKHCFDGQQFTDSLVSVRTEGKDYSQHNQAWAVLSGAATGKLAESVLNQCLNPNTASYFIKTSVAMSFYLLRAMSLASDDTYNAYFHNFWDPWRKQLSLGLTTWEEDTVSQRSDCHAWGCAPIYEFLVEVAGITPALPGWEAINFKPRVSLYKDIEARVPLKQTHGQHSGHVDVMWTTTDHGDVEISLIVTLNAHAPVPMYIQLPSQPLQKRSSDEELRFKISRYSSHDVVIPARI